MGFPPGPELRPYRKNLRVKFLNRMLMFLNKTASASLYSLYFWCARLTTLVRVTEIFLDFRLLALVQGTRETFDTKRNCEPFWYSWFATEHVLPTCTSCQRVLFSACFTFNTATPNKLTATLHLFRVFYSLVFQTTWIAKRPAFAHGDFIASAWPSQ